MFIEIVGNKNYESSSNIHELMVVPLPHDGPWPLDHPSAERSSVVERRFIEEEKKYAFGTRLMVDRRSCIIYLTALNHSFVPTNISTFS